MQQLPKTATTRADIQGLRALAVVAVVVNHLVAWPGGGFVGVDVFFVISGFLITGLLLREHDQTGRISFAEFYRRRVRRILPAALVVLVVTVVASRLLLATSRFGSVLTDAIAALGFAANWRFAATGTDYFQASGPTSPLQHFWSLSVEEQFYLVWPVLLVVVLAVVGRNGALARRGRTSAGIAIGVLGAASFAWAVYETTTSPTVAYFSTFARAWELAAGAGLAIAAPWLARALPSRLRPVLAWLGLGTVLVAIATTAEAPGFPAPGALVAVVGACLVIAAGTPGGSRSLVPLTNPVSRYVGDVSYSLYLWHFPVIMVFGPYAAHLLDRSERDPLVLGLLASASLALASASYHWIEDPIRRSSWLAAKQYSGMRAHRRRKLRPYAQAAVAVVATAVVVGGALGFNALDRPGQVPASAVGGPVVAASPGTAAAAGTGAGTAQSALDAQITKALAADAWPELTNEGDEALPGNTALCGGPKVLDAAECTFGSPDAPHTALLVGDSIAQSYAPGLIRVFGSGDWKLRIMSMYACPFIDTAIGAKPAAAALCGTRKDAEYAAIEQDRPDVVLIANTFLRGHDPDTGQTVSQAAWDSGFSSMIERVRASAGKAVVLPPPAPDKDVAACRTPYSKPGDCISSVSATVWPTVATEQRTATTAAGGVFIDDRRWFCDANARCPAFVGTLLVKKDQAHVTAGYAEYISEVMRESFRRAGVL